MVRWRDLTDAQPIAGLSWLQALQRIWKSPHSTMCWDQTLSQLQNAMMDLRTNFHLVICRVGRFTRQLTQMYVT